MYTKYLNLAPFRQPYQGGGHNFLSRVVLCFARNTFRLVIG